MSQLTQFVEMLVLLEMFDVDTSASNTPFPRPQVLKAEKGGGNKVFADSLESRPGPLTGEPLVSLVWDQLLYYPSCDVNTGWAAFVRIAGNTIAVNSQHIVKKGLVKRGASRCYYWCAAHDSTETAFVDARTALI